MRARLAVLVALVATAAGVGVLLAQYLVVAHLLDAQVRTVAVGSGDVTGVVVGVRDTVLGGALAWSLAIVGVCALLAAVAGWWSAGRSLSRLRDVTRLARATSERDLHARLDLPGPDDEIKELGDTIDAMLARLQRGFEDRERFVADASHELRTPLAATRAALEAPLAQGRFPDDVVPDVRRALAANARSAALVAALLQLARGEVDPVACEVVDLAGTVEAVLDGYAERVAGRGLAVTVDLAPSVVRGDETLLARAVDNVLDNATRYTPAGGRVRVRVGTTDGRARLDVVNDGPTLTPQEAARLLEPFHRGGATGAGGHGLGLAIVRSIAVGHRGGAEVAPAGPGAVRTTVTLPLADR
ncbi:integral membrane sensor signal transduction histidine kinase [Cellulomonas flavigena DSM 20109]|uniref:histidine kinase n=1 Tax=Cellulomonas flavigena (strain ATCC 482 / DSM 20109 / BCRC 11376 / JCM 18109 / NBRC 3775 / NCIMB 8073 / NRS 134) TaxID=446466 RepID=D5UK30_CELFN|nr:integral membrane sensor signal transduction histidine kinase [Cellulomonas flavigena DSM 20109]